MIRFVVSSLKVALIVISTVAVALGGFQLFDHYQSQAEESAGVGEPVVITISKKDSTEDVAEKLRKKGLIRSEAVFELTVRYVDRNIRPATYELKKGMSVSNIVDAITTAKSKAVTKVKDYKLTVIEGWRVEQIAEELDKLKYPPGGDAFLRAVEDYPHDRYDFLDNTKGSTLEGFLYPATYEFTNETTPDELVTMMLNKFDEIFTPAMKKRAREMNLSIYEVVKIASLIEREAVVDDERPLIADVYLKRYDQGWNMEADPTVQYAIGKRDGKWWPVPTAEDLEETDSKYNLYKHSGLPPTPICSPRDLSILAVLQPAESPFMFFVARKDDSGRHLFAATAEEQTANQERINSGEELSEFDSAYTEYLTGPSD
jgi:UPF0755 protein